jgi:hypothetical protein
MICDWGIAYLNAQVAQLSGESLDWPAVTIIDSSQEDCFV